MNPQLTQSNTDYIVDKVFEMLTAKNSMFQLQQDEYKSKIRQQYEMYLINSLMSLLNNEKIEEFQIMLTDYPFDKEMHNKFLKENVEGFENAVVELSGQFVASYGEFIQTL